MPFEWNHRKPASISPGRFRDQFVRSIQERARLLCNLEYGREEVVRRIQAALDWEFDTSIGATTRPSFYDEVPAIVASVYEYAGQPAAQKKKKKSSTSGRKGSTKSRRKL
jgi:hypothetical protein